MSTLDMAEGRNLQRQEHINRNLPNKTKTGVQRNSPGCGKLRTGVTTGDGNTRRGRNREENIWNNDRISPKLMSQTKPDSEKVREHSE